MKQTVFILIQLVIWAATTAHSNTSSDFPVAHSAEEVLELLAPLPQNATVFIDVDDTIITPASKTFRAPPYNKIIDRIKQNKDNYPNYEDIVSNWRLQRKASLIDPQWPIILQKLKECHSTYGLTKMDIGPFGNIPSMEEWRYQELATMSITFTPKQTCTRGVSSIHKGIFFTGKSKKSETVALYLDIIETGALALVDDRLSHLEDLKAFCSKQEIPFLGILYEGLTTLEGSPVPEIANLQEKCLIQNAYWMTDEEASKALEGNLHET